ncbi:helix-turn-helix transcriptional regulator [Pseudomaricurvus alkylphenolicus]|jgi:DNA-binding HxlR family transcriptional regulator|uniref:winged helix-turn-helix transcriptional regulator n=1 Tax=Pseudomaricurvus alkylphenolicus TaxID=1306991 RepID=UPI0014226F07|nr:helix-turn-helix domain-containing protein [Pseudomaricurvus alkylphenolicus]NIB43334.1 helix-turn-helix transcriptional regulator [Pseudomaricurvus alkylphenolicus]
MQIANQIVTNPVARGLNIIGDRWTMLILRDAFLGRHRFNEFREHTGAARGTLANRLEGLVEDGILFKQLYCQSPERYGYWLTEKGLALYPWTLLLWEWESRWGSGGGGGPVPLQHHLGQEHGLKPQCICRHCRQELRYDDVKRVISPDAEPVPASEISKGLGSQRRSRQQTHSGSDQALSHVVGILGDRWTTLILAAMFIGLHRYDDIQQQLGIATNILADRLKSLVDSEVLARSEYQSSPPRFEYRLTEKGKSLYGQTMALRQWVLDNLPPVAHPFRLVHASCGEDLAVDVVCGECKQTPQLGEVQFERDPETLEQAL